MKMEAIRMSDKRFNTLDDAPFGTFSGLEFIVFIASSVRYGSYHRIIKNNSSVLFGDKEGPIVYTPGCIYALFYGVNS